MKKLITAHQSFLTGTELADAVLHYALALHNRHRAALVDIPIITDAGSRARASFAVGWAIDLIGITAPDGDEPSEVDTVIALFDDAASVGVIHAEPFSADELDNRSWPSF